MILTNEDWKYKIINASPTRLVIVTYEIILDRIKSAENELEKGNLPEFRDRINNAKEFVIELLSSLNMEIDVSEDMAELYFFINKLLTKSYFSNDTKYMEAAAGIIERLMEGLINEVDDNLPDDYKNASLSENYSGSTRGIRPGMKT